MSELLLVDEISRSSLRALRHLESPAKSLRFFEPVTPAGARLLASAQQSGLVPMDAGPVDAHIGEVTGADGGVRYLALRAEARETCLRIRREIFEQSPLIRVLPSEWPRTVVAYHFERLIEACIMTERFRYALAAWIAHRRAERAIVVAAKTPWDRYLAPFAQSEGVVLHTYTRPPDPSTVVRTLSAAAVARRSAILAAVRRKVDGTTGRPRPDADRPVIAARYWYRGLSLDPARRSELFWLDGGPLPGATLLIYDYPESDSIPREVLAELADRHVTVVGGPSRGSLRRKAAALAALFARVLAVSMRHPRASRVAAAFLVSGLAQLTIEFIRWHAFFSANGVRVNLVPIFHGSVAQVLALRALGGISANYQYSVSSIAGPSVRIFAGEDVQFVFSEAFERAFCAVDPPSARFLHTGFIYDGALNAARESRRAARVRGQLQRAGAQFVLCFFDENSADCWDIPVSHADAARDYVALLRWIEEDPTLGLVLKPKRANDLRRRIKPVAALLDRLISSGRVVVMDDLGGQTYPAEAAAAADLCIGKLIGSTAALEARLLGTPSVMVDTESFREHPFHDWGDGTAIFPDWTSLRAEVTRYRTDHGSVPRFGEWADLDALDSFRDGKAAVRMREALLALTRSLGDGLRPRDAVERLEEARSTWKIAGRSPWHPQ